jgi:hypothetical protein
MTLSSTVLLYSECRDYEIIQLSIYFKKGQILGRFRSSSLFFFPQIFTYLHVYVYGLLAKVNACMNIESESSKLN